MSILDDDTGWGVPPTFTRNDNTIVVSTGIEDIQQSLTILLNTQIGERFLRPTYGCDLHKYLFEEIDLGFCHYLQDLIAKAIARYEPRITVTEITFDTNNDEGCIYFSISYKLKKSYKEGQYLFPFYVNNPSAINESGA